MMRGSANSFDAAGGLGESRKPVLALDKEPAYVDSPAASFVLFLAYVVFFYLQGGYRFEALGEIRLELIVGSILVIAALFSVLGRQQAQARSRTQTSRRNTSGVTAWIVATFAVAAVMTVLSYDSTTSWLYFVDRVVKLGMMALFISAFVTSPTRLRWFLGAYLFAFLKMAQEGVLGLITGSLVWENQGTPRLHGATPNYAHPNSFSGTQLGTLPFLGYLFPLASRWLKWIIAVQGLSAVIIVITTGSRTGYIALVLWIVFLLLQTRRKMRAIVLAVIVTLVALPLVPTDYMARFETIFTQQDREGHSMDTRKQIYEDAWNIFLSHPFGVGVGAFSAVRWQTYGRDQATHELYLEVACDLGIQGFVIFMGLVIAMLRASRKATNDATRQLNQLSSMRTLSKRWHAQLEQHRRDLALIKATSQAVLSFLVIRLALGLFGHDFYEVYWWFSAGLLIAVHRMLATADARTQWLVTNAGHENDVGPATDQPSLLQTSRRPA